MFHHNFSLSAESVRSANFSLESSDFIGFSGTSVVQAEVIEMFSGWAVGVVHPVGILLLFAHLGCECDLGEVQSGKGSY
jgi:hypothetical protein